MEWQPVYQDIPYGYKGIMGPGTYVIADGDLARIKKKDGIWKADSYFATMDVELGDFKVITESRIYRYGVHKRICVIPIQHCMDPSLGFQFTSSTEIVLSANEMYGLYDIKYEDKHIIVERDDPEEDFMC